MQKMTLHRTQTGLFSAISNDLVYNQEKMNGLISSSFSLDALEKQVKIKRESYKNATREVLVAALKKQYATQPVNPEVAKNLDLLTRENTFTVTTGHQLNLFTGTLYFIYKVLHVIRLAEELNSKNTGFQVVPVYWMASEDHDFAEINHTHLFGKKIEWNAEFGGAVGEYPLENWSELQAELLAFFTQKEDSEAVALIQSYTGKNLSEATFSLVNKLFGKYGLIIIEPNNRELKQLFVPTMEREIRSQFAEPAVLKANKQLEKLSFSPQVFPRPINLFYLSPQKRERIIPSDTGISWGESSEQSVDEVCSELHQFPERFSPNVVLRPVYQETILPNLAYIGGGGEIAYWLQLKGVFDALDLPYPLIQVRNSLQLIDANTARKMEKVGISVEELFQPLDELKKKVVLKEAGSMLDFSEMKAQLDLLSNAIQNQILNIDKGLEGYANAENVKLAKQIAAIEDKLVKHQKNQFQTELKQLEDIKSKQFPRGGVQERSENFFSFCASGEVFSRIAFIKNAIDPFENDLIVLQLD